MSWLRLYVETMDDPKVMQLDPKVFRAWVICLCLAKEGNAGYGIIPPASVVAFKLHVSESAAAKYIAELVEKQLIDVSESGSTPHNWNGRQYVSDVSTSRVKRFRNRQIAVSGNDDETFQKRPQSTEYRVQSTDTPKAPIDRSPIEVWTERLCERHPAPSDPRYPATFCADNWHRLGENEVAYAEWMQAVYRGLEAWCEHWAIDGNRFAQSLDKWLSGGGWKKAPPKVAESSNGKRGQQQSSLPDFDDLINDPYHGGPGR